jgi:spermidine/putrescine transport system permease protein
MSARTAGALTRWAIRPALLWTGALFVVPLLLMLATSFTEHGTGALTIRNYVGFFTRSDGAFADALFNSIEVTLTVTAVSVPVAYPIAYILAYRTPRRWQSVLLVMLILPFWTSYVIRSYSWLVLLSKNGVINQVLLAAGVLDSPVEFGNSRGATVLGFVHFFVMLLTLTIYANLVQIKESYRKAAADLGASPWQSFLYVTLPLSLPGVAVGAFMTFVLAIGDYITPQILGGGRELLLPQAIMLQIERRADFPMASALSMYLMVVVSAAYLLSARYLRMERV